jgi:hypothetical protein
MMKLRSQRLIINGILLCLLAGFLGACGSAPRRGDIRLRKSLQVWTARDLDAKGIGAVAVLPFESLSPTKSVQDSALLCSFCGHPVREHNDFSMAGERLGIYLYEALQKIAPYELIAQEKTLSELRLAHRRDHFSDRAFLRDFGRKLGAEALVVGEILRVRERQGEKYSVVEPASVSFRVTLIRASDGAELYRAVFDETQRPISEEPERLLRPGKLRFRWLTADQLARTGIERVAQAFPGVVNPEKETKGRPPE